MGDKGRFFKEIFKGLVTTCLNIHRQGEAADIVILSSPRSGSTWLMELIATQPGIKAIDEPLNKDLLDYHRLLPIATRWNYLDLSREEREILAAFFLDDQKIRRFGPIQALHKDYHFFTDRRVIKVIRANALIEWFARDLKMDVIYLLRHPIAQSLSCMRRSHHCQIADYLNHPGFAQNYISESLKSYLRNLIERGGRLEKFVAEWCLDNLVPIKASEQAGREWLVVTYEELALNPIETIDLLCRKSNLQAREKMVSQLAIPSKVTDSSTEQTLEKIRRGDRRHLVTKWRQKISPLVEADLFNILDRFEIDVYSRGHYLANSKWLHFPTKVSSDGKPE
jgi:hypothetical protein